MHLLFIHFLAKRSFEYQYVWMVPNVRNIQNMVRREVSALITSHTKTEYRLEI